MTGPEDCSFGYNLNETDKGRIKDQFLELWGTRKHMTSATVVAELQRTLSEFHPKQGGSLSGISLNSVKGWLNDPKRYPTCSECAHRYNLYHLREQKKRENGKQAETDPPPRLRTSMEIERREGTHSPVAATRAEASKSSDRSRGTIGGEVDDSGCTKDGAVRTLSDVAGPPADGGESGACVKSCGIEIREHEGLAEDPEKRKSGQEGRQNRTGATLAEDSPEIQALKLDRLSVKKLLPPLPSSSQKTKLYAATLCGSPVIVKELQAAYGEEFGQEMYREILNHSRARHPNIVQFLGWFREHQFMHLVLRKEGISLHDLIRTLHTSNTELPFEMARKYATHVTSALVLLHAHGTVHRDICLQNIVLSQDCSTAMLIDFGCSKSFEPAEEAAMAASHTIGFFSHPVAVPPELVHNERARKGTHGTPVDIFALSMVLFSLFTTSPNPYNRRVVLQDDGRGLSVYRIADDEAERPRFAPAFAETHARLCCIIEQCWAGVPEARPAAEKVRSVLENACTPTAACLTAWRTREGYPAFFSPQLLPNLHRKYFSTDGLPLSNPQLGLMNVVTVCRLAHKLRFPPCPHAPKSLGGLGGAPIAACGCTEALQHAAQITYKALKERMEAEENLQPVVRLRSWEEWKGRHTELFSKAVDVLYPVLPSSSSKGGRREEGDIAPEDKRQAWADRKGTFRRALQGVLLGKSPDRLRALKGLLDALDAVFRVDCAGNVVCPTARQYSTAEGRQVTPMAAFDYDHFFPYARGGRGNVKRRPNIVVLHTKFNKSKSARILQTICPADLGGLSAPQVFRAFNSANGLAGASPLAVLLGKQHVPRLEAIDARISSQGGSGTRTRSKVALSKAEIDTLTRNPRDELTCADVDPPSYANAVYRLYLQEKRKCTNLFL